MCKRIKLDYFLTLYTKRNLKWIKDLNVSLKAIKLIEENIGSTLSDNNLISKMFLDLFPQARETRTKINKWDYIKLKSFCTVKEMIMKQKSRLLMGEDICKLYIH